MLATQRVAVDVKTPADPDWDAARQAWNLAVDQHPAAVAFPESAADVVALVDAAKADGLRIAVQGTGHGASALGGLEETLLVKTSRMRDAEIDPGSRRARVAAGAQWQDVTGPAAEHGLAALAGSAADVGVVGYTLGGGLGFLARRHGLACNSVRAVELVTADGAQVRADRDEHRDLFWAVRGGGGSFGVVTALEFDLYRVPALYAGVLFWPWERASDVLHAWREWTTTVPVELTSIGRILQVPPLPIVPEPIRGRSFVVVEAAFLGDEATGAELMAPLRALGPEMDTMTMMPPSGLGALHNDPPQPVPGVGDSMLLRELSPQTVDAFVETAGPGSESPLVGAELRHLGGALAVGGLDAGALASIDAPFALYAVGMAATPEMGAAVAAHERRLKDALGAWDSGRSFMNFAEHRTDARRMFGTAATRLLRQIKAQTDPHGLFRANHPIDEPA